MNSIKIIKKAKIILTLLFFGLITGITQGRTNTPPAEEMRAEKYVNQANTYAIKMIKELKAKKYTDLSKMLGTLAVFIQKANTETDAIKDYRTADLKRMLTNLQQTVLSVKKKIRETIYPEYAFNLTAFHQKWYDKRENMINQEKMTSFNPTYIEELRTLNDNVFEIIQRVFEAVKVPRPIDFKKLYQKMTTKNLEDKISDNVKSWWMHDKMLSEKNLTEKQKQTIKDIKNQLQERLNYARKLFKEKLIILYEKASKTTLKNEIKKMNKKVDELKEKYYKAKYRSIERKYFQDQLNNTRMRIKKAKEYLRKK